MLTRLALLAAVLIAPVHAMAAEIHLLCHFKALADGAPSTRTVVIDTDRRTVTDNGRVFRDGVPGATPGLEAIVTPQTHGFFWGQRDTAAGRSVESFSVDLQTGEYLGDGWLSGPVARGTCVVPQKTS